MECKYQSETERYESSLVPSHPLHRTRAVMSQGRKPRPVCPIDLSGQSVIHRVNGFRLFRLSRNVLGT